MEYFVAQYYIENPYLINGAQQNGGGLNVGFVPLTFPHFFSQQAENLI